MNHVFIINPKAGKKDISNYIIGELNKLKDIIKYSVYITSNRNDAFLYTKKYCEEHDEATRFYACGGDGTLNEVVNGVMGFDNKQVTCYPCGSGNDFVKNFGVKEDFLDLLKLINGSEVEVDLLKVNDRYTINICNLGFDAFVADNMVKFKNKPLMNGHSAYTMAVLYSVLFKMKHKCQIFLDDEEIYDNYMLLCAVANGKCYGGGYYCAPEAKVDDGLIDFCLAKKVTRVQLFKMIKKYKQGLHLVDNKVKNFIMYKKCKKITIKAPNELIYCMDGEIAKSNKIDIIIHQRAIKFIIPQKNLDLLI